MYKILHNNQPEQLAKKFQNTFRINPNNTRLLGPNKLGPRPKSVGWTMVTRRQFRAQAYDFYSVIPDYIKSLSNYTHFTKWVKQIYKHGATTAYDKLPWIKSWNIDQLTLYWPCMNPIFPVPSSNFSNSSLWTMANIMPHSIL